MKTTKEMQAAVDAILEVCKQHGVVLIGNCYSEGIWGEIELIDVADVSSDTHHRITNTVEDSLKDTIYVLGIGGLGKQ